MNYILTINLGSTSTKTSVFQDELLVTENTIYHDPNVLAGLPDVYAQFDLRREGLLRWLDEAGFAEMKFSAVVARGGFTQKVPGGVWQVGQEMLDDLASGEYGVHVCNIAARLAYELFGTQGIPCFVVDPPVLDEYDEVSRISGLEGMERRCIIHALNQKAVARSAAKELGKPYDQCRMIIAHMGGGISVGAHLNGKIVDSNDGLQGDGPFSPERSGGLPAMPLIDLCFDGAYSREEMKRKITGAGGMISYTGTSDMRVLVERAKTDARVKLLVDAMCYQIAKEICSFLAVMGGAPDVIVLTGGLAHADEVVESIQKRVGWLGKILVFPGEDEHRAMALGALRVLRGEEPIRVYHK